MPCCFRRSALALCALIALAAPLRAEITLAPPFGNGMVIQRDRPITVRGRCPGATAVSVKFAGKTAKALPDAEGAFEVSIGPVSSAGPHKLVLTADTGDRLALNQILAGEVWLCSGQSNMYWPVSRSKDGRKEISAANHPGIRLLTVPRRAVPEPAADLTASWVTCSPETVPRFSAVAYYFGRELRRKIKEPIGLIHSSVGGTPVEAWTRGKPNPGAKVGVKSPTALWNGMIAPLVGFPIRGVIWYQGESNARRAAQYRNLFPGMIRDWRVQWGQEKLPFLFVQLANFGKNRPAAERCFWAELRDAQLHTLRTVPDTGMAVTIDIGNPRNIHPVNKQDVGKRLALWALANTYGKKKVVVSGPLYRDHRIERDRVIVTFDHVGGGLKLAGDTGFVIAGEDRDFLPAKASVVGKTLVLRHAAIVKPAAVRYAWANSPTATLFNKEGLPASPFRTDEW
jgi:sialate O-acetylesterase